MSIVNAATVTLKSREEILDIARRVLDEKPRSYVEAAFELAKYLVEHFAASDEQEETIVQIGVRDAHVVMNLYGTRSVQPSFIKWTPDHAVSAVISSLSLASRVADASRLS